MRKLHSKMQPTMNELTGGLMRQIASLTSDFEYLLPNGWRAIIEIHSFTEQPTGSEYLLDLQSDIGGGSFAPAKIKTLEIFPSINATGGETIKDLQEMVEEIDRKSGQKHSQTEMFSELCNLPHSGCIKGKLREWLRDQCEISPYYGGIRIPFACISADSYPYTGEVLIAFSGAIEWQDLFFAFTIFRELQKLLNHHFPKNLYTYDLAPLKTLCETSIWINLYGIGSV